MRRSDRQINDFNEILSVLDGCDTIRVALNDSPYPYVVPLSFGYEVTDGRLCIYFHCAKEGKKLDLLQKDCHVCVEADSLCGYVEKGESITADYKSVIAFGKAEVVFGSELVHGLELLLKHCNISGHSAEACAAKNITCVVKISVDEITGKKRFIK